jgi:uracil-DNA glycosylase
METCKVRIVKKPNLEKWSLPEIIANYVPASWKDVFAETKEERKELSEIFIKKIIPNRNEIYPAKEYIYRAFDLTPLYKVRVVIIGQDPYPTPGKAQGISFSISPTDKKIPPSLKNIFREIKLEYPDFVIPNHGDLRKWCQQGVLLLNSALTFAVGDKTHDKIWASFYTKTISKLVLKNPNIIWVLWGNKAQSIIPYLGRSPILKSNHPSPNAQNRDGDFIGNGHFKKINELLEEQGDDPIDWQI